MRNEAVKKLTTAAVTAAIYAVLTFVLAPFSFGPFQFRLSEMLTVLPAVYPPALFGISVGCFISNLLGFFLGLNPLGVTDCIFGTFATVLAAVLTYFAGKRFKGKALYFFAALPAVITNTVIIGLELSVILGLPFYLTAVYIFIPETVSCFAGSVLLLKNFQRIFKK